MKKCIHLPSFALLAALILSCGDDEAKENQSKLIGTWIASDIILDCKNQENSSSTEVDCTEESCIRYIFQVDSTDRKLYFKKITENNITQTEIGNFSVGESSVSFCQENEGETTCYSSDLKLSNTELQLTTKTDDDDCKETIFFYKESMQ